jgi:hypothetical protein
VVHYIVCASLALAGIDSYYSSIDRRLERSREPLHPNCVYRQFSSWQVLAQDLVQVYVVGPGWPLRSWVVQTPLSLGSRSYCSLFRFGSSSLTLAQRLGCDYREPASWELLTLMAMEICVRLLCYLAELLTMERVVDMGSLGRDSFQLIGAVQSRVGEMGCLAVIAAPGLVERALAGTRYWQLGFLEDVAYISFADFELR